MNSFLLNVHDILEVFPAALAAGLLISAACSFLGNLVVLKRMVFIGAALSESAACGIAMAFFFHFHPVLGAVLLNLGVVTLLAFSSQEERLPRDAVLAAIFIFTASLGILFVSKSAVGLEEVKSLLYGDILLTSVKDLKILAGILIPLSMLALIFIRPVTYTFVDRDEAKVLGIKVRLWELVFYYILGITVSAASKLAGMLLVFCYLVIPPMTGLLLSSRLRNVILLSGGAAVVSTLTGFYISYVYDLPANQTIAFAACMLLGAALAVKTVRGK